MTHLTEILQLNLQQQFIPRTSTKQLSEPRAIPQLSHTPHSHNGIGHINLCRRQVRLERHPLWRHSTAECRLRAWTIRVVGIRSGSQERVGEHFIVPPTAGRFGLDFQGSFLGDTNPWTTWANTVRPWSLVVNGWPLFVFGPDVIASPGIPVGSTAPLKESVKLVEASPSWKVYFTFILKNWKTHRKTRILLRVRHISQAIIEFHF